MFKYMLTLLYILYTCICIHLKLIFFGFLPSLYPIFLELIVASSNPSAECIFGEVATIPTNVCKYFSRRQTNKFSCRGGFLEFCPLKVLSFFVRTKK